MKICSDVRNYILEWGAMPHLAPLILFGSDGFPNDGTNEGENAVAHIQTCEKCNLWLRDLTNTDAIQRMERLSRYCCPQMFVAVEEPEDESIHLKIRLFRDENLWIIDQPSRDFGFEFFSFCPWCGKRFPEHPFIDDEKGRG